MTLNRLRFDLTVILACLLVPGVFRVPGLEAFAQTRTDVFITTTGQGGPDSLDATVFTPVSPAPPGGYPGIIFVHGFGGSKDSDTASGRVFSQSGYLTLCYSVRGHGNSSGGSRIMSLTERADLADVVNYFRSLPGIDTTAIGLTGGSQGGLHGLWALADRLPLHAVSSDVIVPGWASDMLTNGSVRRTLTLLLNSSRVRYDAVRDSLWELVRTDDYDGLLKSFPPERDIDTVSLNSSTVPSLRLLKWQDHYFAAGDGVAAFDRYAGPRKFYGGTRGHFSDQVESERLYQHDQVSRWLAHYLKGASNGIDLEPVYTYAYSSLPMDSSGYFLWTRTPAQNWPLPGAVQHRFYLQADTTLGFGPIPGPAWFPVSNILADSEYTFEDGFDDGFQGSAFEDALPKVTVAFESPPLPWDVEWSGEPEMSLHFISSYAKFPLHVQIYEVDSSGARYFINRINFTQRDWPGGQGVIQAKGIAHAHLFKGGNRVRVELTNIDVSNRIEPGPYPFVVPMFADAEALVLAGPAEQSWISLPLMQSPTGVAWEETGSGRGPGLVSSFPNPFNHTTSIEIRIPTAGRAMIRIHDLLGREVSILLDADLNPGGYVADWNASGLASGIYFARITLRPFAGGGRILYDAVKLSLLR